MPGQMKPVIFSVYKKREIIWMQAGRSGNYFGDKELQEYLDCDFEIAMGFTVEQRELKK